MADKPQLNIDDLYDTKKKNDLNRLDIYNKLLIKIHAKIKTASRLRDCTNFCSYIMPEVLIGYPNYHLSDCLLFIIDSLQKNGFLTRYIHPNLLLNFNKFNNSRAKFNNSQINFNNSHEPGLEF